MNIFRFIAAALAVFYASHGFGVARDVQIQSVDFTTAVVQITNLGGSTENIAGYRFCTHNSAVVRRYSSGLPTAPNTTLAPGASLYVHLNNDASGADAINASSIGGAFAALERDAYGMQIYFPPVSFGNGNTIADHLQWSIGGVDNLTADERSDEAETGGVWVDQMQWISVTAQSEKVNLDDLSGAVLHSPANYSTDEPPPPNPAENIPMLPWPLLAGLFALLALLGLRNLRVS